MPQVNFNNWQIEHAAEWIGDFLSREHLLPGGALLDAAQFYALNSVLVTVDTAGAAADAVSVPVKALSGALPNGTVLDFGGKKFARLTAAAAAGAISVTVAALPTALASGDAARYAGTGVKVCPSGTLLGRTLSERDAGTGFGPAADADEEFYLQVYDVYDVDNFNNATLYRHGSIVRDNLLPGFSSLSTALKAKVRALYTCVRGES